MLFKNKKNTIGVENPVIEITEQLLKLKLPNDLHFKVTKTHIFPDGYIVGTKENEKMFYLKQNNKEIALFKFGINYFTQKKTIEPTITIDFIQGIKQKSKIDMLKKWPEIIVNSFLFSCIPTITKTPQVKIRYGEFIPLRDGKDRNENRKKYIEVLKKELEIEIKMGRKNTPKGIYLKNQITVAENRLKFVNALRDRYFDKEGFLNPNKKRIKEIYNLHTKKPKYVLKKKTFKKLKLKKITIKRKL